MAILIIFGHFEPFWYVWSFWSIWACKLISILFFQVTHPADVVKTRMQLEPALYPSVSKACKQIVLMNGPRGFLIGLAPRMLRRTLMSAMAWTVYEEIMRQLGLKWYFFLLLVCKGFFFFILKLTPSSTK